MTHARIASLTLLMAILLAGCKEVDVTDPKVAAAVGDINAEFRSGYRQVLVEMGTRHFDLPQAEARRAMQEVLQRMGFAVVNSEGDYYLSVTAPAPTPLDSAEWEEVRRAHEPRMKDIAAIHLGFKGRFVKLEPEGLNILGVLTFVPAARGVDISITMRLQEVRPQSPESILPRREYPPPHAVRIGYGKIWSAFAEQTASHGRIAATLP
jgi:hypothetical protein